MTEVLKDSEIPPVTTEIPLNGENDEATSETGDTAQQNGVHAKETSNAEENTLKSTAAPTSGQTYIGSSSVGSRLAGDNSVGSRLASTGVAANNQSPVYNPKATLDLSRSNSVKLGFGNTVQPNPTKLGNMTLQEVQQVAAVKAENLKSWSVKTYKCTKQILSEKLGRGTRTVDLELEAKIEILKDTKRKYENLLMLTKTLANHFNAIIQTQKVLSSAFAELSTKSQELQDEFRYNAETQLVVAKNGENLLSAINFFTSGVTTLCAKTMEDSLLTISKYESARLSFDAYKSELGMINLQPRTEANILKQANAQSNFDGHKAIYDRLREDVGVKLQFLDENRVKVMQKHLLLFHNAVTAYFAGNQQQLESTLQQFNINSAPDSSSSFLEKE